MQNMQIRIAQPLDAAYIALLGRITFSETFGHLFRNTNELQAYNERTFSVQKIRGGIAKAENIFWLAFVNELPVGYAKLKIDSPSEFIQEDKVAQLQKLYVLKDFLSMKVGKALQSQVIAKAREDDCEVIWLSVLQSNARAIRFYQKNSFQQVGEHSYQIGQENFHFFAMAKALTI